jgi:putative transposase
MSQRHPIQNGFVMLVTTNIARRQRLFASDVYAREAIDALFRTQELYPFFLFAFVIMPDHMHMLISVPEPGSISSVVRSYKRAVSHAIGKGPIWQPRFHMRIVDNANEARSYIHLNPVRASLTQTADTYRWSSASGRWDVCDLDVLYF